MAITVRCKYRNLIKFFICVMCLKNVTTVLATEPVILTANVLNVTVFKDVLTEDQHRNIFIELKGENLENRPSKHRPKPLSIMLTPNIAERGSTCVFGDREHKVIEVWANRTTVYIELNISSVIPLPDSRLFVCLAVPKPTYDGVLSTRPSTFSGEVIKWVHQGVEVKLLKFKNDVKHAELNPSSASESRSRERRDAATTDTDVTPTSNVSSSTPPAARAASPSAVGEVHVYGVRVEHANKDLAFGDDGVPEMLASTSAVIRLFGTGFTATTQVTFTSRTDESNCEFPITDSFTPVVETLADANTVLINIRVPPINTDGGAYYVCIKGTVGGGDGTHVWKHQGAKKWLAIRSYQKMLPIWVSIVIILTCLFFSALFSGLNLGLMSLDQTDLKIVANTGSEEEKRYARAIMPVRKTGNYLLCSILLGNVLVNSTLTILMDDLTSGLVAIIGSTFCIVIFGEITPQAICSRHGLAVGAKTIYVTKMVMMITFPLSYPISKLLDLLLGVELGNVYTRERLKELVKVTTEYNDLEKDEVNIISGALELRRKTVKEVMTKLEDAFMLNYDAILDFETVSDIMKQGYSRIPVYEGERTNIITTLFIKDLAFVDPDDSTPLKTLCKFYQNPCNFVFEDTTLDIMFRQFKEGIKGHMAFVHRVNSEGEGDPFYETVGLVTLEDVIEELIQAEIVDETDVWTDNRSKRRRNQKVTKQDFTIFAERRENQSVHITPQLTLATFQYLSATVDAFKPEIISETILRRLLKQDIVHMVKIKNKERAETIIYTQGKPVDYFVLILEGRVEVIVGQENMRFESGPFTYFGNQALIQNIGIAESPASPSPAHMGSLQSVNMESLVRHTFVPDYTVRAVTDCIYIRIRRSLYLAAKRATLMELEKKDTQSSEHFDDEVEKLLHSLDDEDNFNSPTLSHKDPSNQLSQSDKNALQRCIEAAERGGGLTGTDMTLLQSLSSNNGAPRSPPPHHHGDDQALSPSRVLPLGPALVAAPADGSQDYNGGPGLSPVSVKKVGDNNRKFSRGEFANVNSSDSKEERTTLLPQSSLKL